jgi:hypothetical protein
MSCLQPILESGEEDERKGPRFMIHDQLADTRSILYLGEIRQIGIQFNEDSPAEWLDINEGYGSDDWVYDEDKRAVLSGEEDDEAGGGDGDDDGDDDDHDHDGGGGGNEDFGMDDEDGEQQQEEEEDPEIEDSMHVEQPRPGQGGAGGGQSGPDVWWEARSGATLGLSALQENHGGQAAFHPSQAFDNDAESLLSWGDFIEQGPNGNEEDLDLEFLFDPDGEDGGDGEDGEDGEDAEDGESREQQEGARRGTGWRTSRVASPPPSLPANRGGAGSSS